MRLRVRVNMRGITLRGWVAKRSSAHLLLGPFSACLPVSRLPAAGPEPARYSDLYLCAVIIMVLLYP